MEQSKEKNKISSLGLATVVLYIVATLFFQTNSSEKLLMSINNNVAFWDKYFNLLFYGLFAMFFLMIYFHQIQISVKEFEKENLKYIVGGFVFIIVTMVASAILLSCYGIGESANEEAVSRDFVENRWITYIYAVVLRPFAEEMVFRYHIYNLIKGKKANRWRVLCGIVVTSFLFMIYHCDIIYIFDYEQILSLVPIFFMGVGLAYIQEKTSNIICPMIAHMVINSI